MVGGGQLARMTHQAAIALGQNLRVLVTSADDPAAQVTPNVVIGSHTDLAALRRVAAGADVLTFDHEHVPNELLEKLVADGVNVAPSPQALVHAQDKLVMRQRLAAAGVAVPRYAGIKDPDEIDVFAARVDAPIVVKAVRGGYDGRGVRMARDVADARDFARECLADGVAVLVEERVDLRRELSALVARSPFGQGAAWPVVQTVQRDGTCVLVIAPAPARSPAHTCRHVAPSGPPATPHPGRTANAPPVPTARGAGPPVPRPAPPRRQPGIRERNHGHPPHHVPSERPGRRNPRALP